MKKVALVTILIAGTFIHLIAQQQKPTKKSADNPEASVSRGLVVYQKVCLSCHQADGYGVPHMNPPLAGNTDVLGKDKKKIIGIVLHGMTDRIPLDDEYYNNNMASHADLTNQQIADVLTYIRNSFGNKAEPVTIAEVMAVRKPKK